MRYKTYKPGPWQRVMEKVDGFFYEEGARDKKDRPWIVFFWALFAGALALEWAARKRRKAGPLRGTGS